MKTAFIQIYNSFFDVKANAKYILNGTGKGKSVLLALAMLLTLVVGSMAFKYSTGMQNLSEQKIADIFPTLTVQNGKIISPADYETMFVSKDQVFFIKINTASDLVQWPKDIQRGILLTQNSLFIKNISDIRKFPLSDFVGENKQEITPHDIKQMYVEFIQYMRFVLIGLVVLLVLPISFCVYLIFGYFFAMMSMTLTSTMNLNLISDQRMRLAAVSLAPVEILNSLAILLNLQVRFGYGIVLILTMIFMYVNVKQIKVKMV